MIVSWEECNYDSSVNLIHCTEYGENNTIQKITEYITIDLDTGAGQDG